MVLAYEAKVISKASARASLGTKFFINVSVAFENSLLPKKIQKS
jgi:hypothetical protein